MVHDLFETVLAFDGFDLRLKQKPRNGSYPKLTGMESDLEHLTVDEGSTSESQPSEKSVKSLALTPSLVAHMDAALKSAATPSSFERSGIYSTGGILMGLSRDGELHNLRPLAPHNDYHVAHHSTWMEYELPLTPGPTGLNAVEWFVYFRSLDSPHTLPQLLTFIAP